MAMVLKTIVAATSPWVRIPRPPLSNQALHRQGRLPARILPVGRRRYVTSRRRGWRQHADADGQAWAYERGIAGQVRPAERRGPGPLARTKRPDAEAMSS